MNHNMNLKKIIIINMFVSIGISSSEPLASYKTNKYIDAYFIDTEILVDGVIDENQWELVDWRDDFIQSEPKIFENPSYRTSIKVLYNDNSLFIAARMESKKADSIKEKIAERDDWAGGFEEQSDWFSIDIDSRHNHRSGNSFIVNASGVQSDQLIFDGDIYDSEWDAVWSSATSIDKFGWYLEVEIPFSMLRFEKNDEYTWGVNFSRYIYDLDELVSWVVIPANFDNIVSGFGHIGNIQGIYPPSRFEIVPYIFFGALGNKDILLNSYDYLGSGSYIDSSLSYNAKIGIDLKYKINTSNHLDLVFNPDFGQIESDPSKINLTSYEIYYDDKRPFFNDGLETFSTPIELFYSRRIGQDSWSLDTLRDGKFRWIKVPTRIIGASKIIGQTGIVSYGLISSISSSHKDSENNEIGNLGSLKYFTNAPNIFQNIFRLKTEFGSNGSFIGIMNTVSNSIGNTSVVSSMDSKINFSIKNIQISATPQLIYNDNRFGIHSRIDISFAKNIDFWSQYQRLDSNIEINNLGYLWRDNVEDIVSGLKLESNQSLGFLRRYSLIVNHKFSRNLDKLVIDNTIDLSLVTKITRGWFFGMNFFRSFEHLDDRKIWIDDNVFGPPVKVSSINGAGLSFKSPLGKALEFGYDLNGARNDLGDYLIEYDLKFDYSLNSNFNLSLHYNSYNLSKTYQYIEGFDYYEYPDSSDFIFSHIDRSDKTFTLSMNKYFDKSKSMRLYIEYYKNYDRYGIEGDSLSKLIVPNEFPSNDPSIFEDILYSEDPDPDGQDYLSPNLYLPFYPSYNSLVTTLIYNWTYMQGSDLFLIYSYRF